VTVGGVISFKYSHPVHYWIRILCFAFSIVFLMLWIGSDEGLAAGTPIWEPEEEINYNAMQSSAKWSARGPNNIVYRAYIEANMALNVSFTSDNGTTWNDTQIIDAAWKSHTNLIIGGLCVMANNTTLVHFIANGADDLYNSYIACRWNWSGDWDIIKIFGSGSTGMAYPKMAINETKVLLTYFTANHIRTKVFDPSDSSVVPIAPTLPSSWFPAADSNGYNYDICVNQSGLFIIATMGWSGANYRYYVRDLEGVHGAVYATEPWGLYKPYGVNLVCTSDDLFALGAIMATGGNFWILHQYEVTQWGGFAYTIIDSQTDDKDYYGLGHSIDVNDYLTYYYSDATGTGEDVYISKTRALIDASEATWESNIIHGVYDYGTDNDAWRATGWYCEKYPVVQGQSVNIPLTGYMGEHTYKNELGTPDDYSFALYWNATFYWYDWSVPDPDPDPETPTNETVSDWLWWGDAACISSAMILCVILLVAVIFIQMTTRR